MADRQLVNPTGAFGYTDLQTKLWSIEAPMLTSAAVTGPAVVAINTAGLVATAATDGTASLAVGIAIENISSGYVGGVVVYGIAENVTADGTITAGLLLKRSTNTAGAVMATATPAIGEVLGVAINASASGTVDVWVRPGALS